MILTAYFSHSGENYFSGRIVSVEKGNTAVVAEKIAAMTGCDLFEIRRKEPYPDKYSDCVKEAVSEMKSAARPDLCENVDISAYDVVILGYPNWCGTMPAPVFTFLEINDFSGKRMLPFCTNEGSGLGKSVADIKTLCPSAHVGEGLSVRGGSVQDCDAELKTWLEKKRLAPGGNIMDKKIEEYVKKVDETIAAGKFKDNWESLSAHKTPDWYRQGRFGIFIHWGVYSVPAFGNEWYPRRMYDKTDPVFLHHIAKYGKKFEYRHFIDRFSPDKYVPAEWAKLFADAGAKFVMPVCEHHDGIKMYGSDLNRWNMVSLKGRDYMLELKEQVEKAGMTFLASNHRAEHYWFMNFARKNFPESEVVATEEFRDLYGPAYCPPSGHARKTDQEISATTDWLYDWLASSCEMIDRLQPSAVYFDWWIQKSEFKPYLKKFLAYYYNRAEEWGKQVTVFYKVGAVMNGCATYDVERGQVADVRADVWQSDTSTARNSWCYTDLNIFKPSVEIISNLIDVVSKNGCFMLNVGPKADGEICDKDKKILSDIGEWLKINGEAIYDASPCEVGFGEGRKRKTGSFVEKLVYGRRDYRFTFKTGAIYAFQMFPAYRKEIRIKKLAFSSEKGIRYDIKNVELLGSGLKIKYYQDESGLYIGIPEKPDVPFPYCFKVTVD